MGVALTITRQDHSATELRTIAGRCADGAQVRRLLALVLVLEGRSRTEAAAQNGMSTCLAPSARPAAVGAAIIMPAANTEAMNEHLKEISAQVAPGAHAALLIDGAGWHQTGEKLQVPANITLLTLPPYSPEMNPMENVWEFLRANKLCNLAWNCYDAIVEACKKAWDFLVNDPDRVRSIGFRDWAWVTL